MLMSEGCQAPLGVPCRSYVVVSDKNITFYYIHVFFFIAISYLCKCHVVLSEASLPA